MKFKTVLIIFIYFLSSSTQIKCAENKQSTIFNLVKAHPGKTLLIAIPLMSYAFYKNYPKQFKTFVRNIKLAKPLIQAIIFGLLTTKLFNRFINSYVSKFLENKSFKKQILIKIIYFKIHAAIYCASTLLSIGYQITLSNALWVTIDNNNLTPQFKLNLITILIFFGACNNGLMTVHEPILIQATRLRQIYILKYLLSCMNCIVDFDNLQGDTALHAAVENHDLESTQLLISAGANPNICNIHRVNPLMIAVQKRHADTANLLLHSGEPINFELLILNAFDDEFLNLLINNIDVFINQQDSNGETLLRRYLEKQDIEKIRLLISKKADPSICDKNGLSDFRYAAQHCSIEIFKMLFTNGYKVVNFKGIKENEYYCEEEEKKEEDLEINKDECCICLNNQFADFLYFTKCNHLFHAKCIKKWLTNPENDNCPTCRYKL